jgi:hypothetical protein
VTADEVVELGFEKGELRVERRDLKRLTGNALFGSFDPENKTNFGPTTRFALIFWKRCFSLFHTMDAHAGDG